MFKNLRQKLNFIWKFLYSLLKKPSGKGRAKFLKILPKNSIGAEIGVFKGEFSKYILKVIQPKKLYLIDGWWKVRGEYFSWNTPCDNFGKLKTRETFEEAKRIVKKYDKNKVCAFHIDNDLFALKRFPNRYFDWVYLDTCHSYEQCKKELEILKDKVKEEGFIAGHDFFPYPKHIHHGVYKAVKEFIKKHNYEIIYLDNSTQWCIRKKAIIVNK